ncbi:MAG: hypothetical protein CM15mP18_3180 [Methanobacteriota archaeon]|nr:MAG: hypothetical protein CM15mP18_3180 [Euryarchaeota archaeon]
MIFLERVRSKVPVFQLMFEGFDRPEDRPHTLLWLWTQYAAGFAVMVPMILVVWPPGYEALVTIPILINIVGDGLAEPVGVRLGSANTAFEPCSPPSASPDPRRQCACVLITGIVVLLMHAALLTTPQFVAGLSSSPSR